MNSHMKKLLDHVMGQMGEHHLTPYNVDDVVAAVKKFDRTVGRILEKDIRKAALSDSMMAEIYKEPGRVMTLLVTKHILDHYQLSDEIPIEFTAKKTSYYRLNDGKRKISYGYASADRSYDNGFWEYSTVAKKLGQSQNTRRGFYGAYRLAIHETAHAIDREFHAYERRNGRWIHHGDNFVKTTLSLLDQFPLGMFDKEMKCTTQ